MTTIIIIVLCVSLGLLICLGLAIANFAGENFYDKYMALDKEDSKSELTSLGFFQMINKIYFNEKLRLGGGVKEGGDAYAKGILFLSERTMTSSSLASLAIVAHELGHAKQDQDSNKLKKINTLRRAGRVVGYLLFPFAIAAVLLLVFGQAVLGYAFAGGALLIFLLAIIIKAASISIEKEASKNAIVFLKEALAEDEIKKCKQFLDDAKLTYWADMFRAILGWTMLTRKGKLFR